MVALDVKARVARGQMEFGPGAGQAVISPDGQELYITQLSSDYAVHILRLGPQPVGIGEVQFTASAGPDSEGNRSLALSRDGSHLYFADERTSTVSVGDTHATWGHPSAQVVQVAGGARHLVLSPDGKRLYIIGQFLSWLDTATGKLTNGSVVVGGDTRAVAISPDGRRLYVADHRWSFVNVIDLQANKITDSIRPGCGTGPVSIALSRDGTRLYTACEGSSVVSTNDTTTGSAVGKPVTVGSRPYTMALSPDGGRLYVATVDGGNVEVATVDTAAGTVVQPPIIVANWFVSPSPSATTSPTT
jgi:YVTN family beta-propeller protein